MQFVLPLIRVNLEYYGLTATSPYFLHPRELIRRCLLRQILGGIAGTGNATSVERYSPTDV